VRLIAKGKAPKTLLATAMASTTSLKTAKSARGAFEQVDKGEVRVRLSEDQGGLCAFCMGRIDPEKRDAGRPTIRIAHLKPIDSDPARALHWTNLLGSCSSSTSCDVAQGSEPLATDPTVLGHIAKLAYETKGKQLVLTSLDANTTKDVEVLGLNRGDLPSNRYGAWMAFLRRFERAKTNTYGKPAWREFFDNESRNPLCLPEYLGVIETKVR